MQDTIQKRLKGANETAAKYEATLPIMDMLAARYGTDASDPAALLKAIEADNEFLSDAAADKNMDDAAYKGYIKLERENARLKASQAEQQKQAQLEQMQQDLETARMSAEDLHDESTAQIEQDLENIEAINIKVRANFDRERAEQDAQLYQEQYDGLTADLERTRQAKIDLLNGAALPLEGLSVENGELTYKGKKWDGMSGSDQLKVATAIVRALNPKCGFVLLDKLEQMDLITLNEFGAWLESQNLQAIATRVSTGSECTIIIEDGQIAGQALPEITAPNNWKAGVF